MPEDPEETDNRTSDEHSISSLNPTPPSGIRSIRDGTSSGIHRIQETANVISI